MDKHYLARKCDCGNVMRVLVDHDEHFVKADGCFLCYRGKLRHKVRMPVDDSFLIGHGRFACSNYIETVMCNNCLKHRRIRTFK